MSWFQILALIAMFLSAGFGGLALLGYVVVTFVFGSKKPPINAKGVGPKKTAVVKAVDPPPVDDATEVDPIEDRTAATRKLFEIEAWLAENGTSAETLGVLFNPILPHLNGTNEKPIDTQTSKAA